VIKATLLNLMAALFTR